MRKKIIYGICMLGLVALVATSCKKNEENADSFAASYGTLEVGSIDDDDRAYIDPTTNNTLWETGDQIKIFNFENGRSAIYQTEANGLNVGQFVNINPNNPLGNATKYYSFYPAQMATADFDGTYQTFTLEPIQFINRRPGDNHAAGGISIPQAAVSEVSNGSFFLQHHLIFGVAQFRVACGANPYVAEGEVEDIFRYVQRIRVTDNHFNLHGTVTMKPNKIDAGELSAMMVRLKNYGLEDSQYLAKWQSYVIDELGYSATGSGKTLEMDYTALHGGKGVKLAGESAIMKLPVGLRPGAFVNGFILEMDILEVDGSTVTLRFPNTDQTLDFFNDYVPEDWSNPSHHRMVMEPKTIKIFHLNKTNGNCEQIDDYINAIYRRDNPENPLVQADIENHSH